jgi:hypothetical protein
VSLHPRLERQKEGFELNYEGDALTLGSFLLSFFRTNAYWINRLVDTADVELTFKTLKKAGIKVLRSVAKLDEFDPRAPGDLILPLLSFTPTESGASVSSPKFLLPLIERLTSRSSPTRASRPSFSAGPSLLATNHQQQTDFFRFRHRCSVNYGPDGLQRMDEVVRLAEKYGVKLVVAFTNNVRSTPSPSL